MAAMHGLGIVEAGRGDRHGVWLESLRWFIPVLIGLLAIGANVIAAEPSPPNDYLAVDAIFTEQTVSHRSLARYDSGRQWRFLLSVLREVWLRARGEPQPFRGRRCWC